MTARLGHEQRPRRAARSVAAPCAECPGQSEGHRSHVDLVNITVDDLLGLSLLRPTGYATVRLCTLGWMASIPRQNTFPQVREAQPPRLVGIST